MSTAIIKSGHLHITTSFNDGHLRAIPGWGAPAIRRGPTSNGGSSAISSTDRSISGEERNIARDEPSFITNGLCYSNERAHWLNAVRGNGRLGKAIARHLVNLGVARLDFTLDHPENLVNLDPMLHSAMDKFGMITVTLSLESLDRLTQLLKKENEVWQEQSDKGCRYARCFSIFRQGFASSTYELVILHPKHFLPCGSVLPVYSGAEYTPTLYQVAPDGVLRQFPLAAGRESPRLPPFAFNPNFRQTEKDHLNPLLVALSSQIKFRRYERSDWPELEDHTRLLMKKTTILVDAIYWKPVRLAPAVQHNATSSDEEGDWSGEDRWSGEESEEAPVFSAPASRNRRGRGRSSQPRDPNMDEEVMLALAEEDDFTMDEMFDMMSGPNDHELDEDDQALLSSLWDRQERPNESS